MFHNLPTPLGLIIVSAPALLAAILGIASLIERPLSERTSSRLVQIFLGIGLVTSVVMLIYMLTTGARQAQIELGNWVSIPHFHFHVKLLFDRLSIPFVILTFVLCLTIGAFASRYLHRERGYNRFFTLFALFALGMTIASVAGTIETLFTGWELVGISSALLVAFFQERVGPVRNGLRVWTVYRVSDTALLIAAVALHHLSGEGDFSVLLGSGSWPDVSSSLSHRDALIVGSLLLIAAAGKSALVPFSGWLPRAMEGPTPSSAVFYGALSVHLGAFLLLRVDVLQLSPWLGGAAVLIGLLTAVFAALVSRVQTDIKSALSFASLTQVGIIVMEIGFGLKYLALAHIVGHACLRTLQFLRASSLLQDYRTVENALGARLPQRRESWLSLAPARWQVSLYRFALARGHLDACLDAFIVWPVLAIFRQCDLLERRWTDLLAGKASRESDELAQVQHTLEELP